MLLLFFNPSEGGGGAPNEFTPPIREETPRIEYTATALENRWSAHFQRGGVACNVYKLLTGLYTENHPGDEALISFTYFGGRSYVVSDAEKTALVLAGYSVS